MSLNYVSFTRINFSGNRTLPLLDLLLSAEKDGLIDSDGVGEEVDTFIAAVSIELSNSYLFIYI